MADPQHLPWPPADELIEGVAVATEAAARRYDLPQAVGEGAYAVEDDGANWGPYCQCWTWAAERWRSDQLSPAAP